MPPRPRSGIVDRVVANAPRLRQDQVIIVGVSGGRDSVALLHAVIQAGYRRVVVAHLDHVLRPDSEDDAWFTCGLAEQYQVSFEAARADVRAFAEAQKISIEEAAREARYAFFAQTARNYWCPRIVLAHHADDQVETLLLNLCRGAGRAGLAGMPPIAIREVHGARLEIHRPFLGIWREEIDAYIAQHALQFREDPSNGETQFTRNRIRHQVLPMLEQAMGRDVRGAIHRTADILGAEECFLEQSTPKVSLEPLEVDRLRLLPEAIQRRTIFAWLQGHAVADLGYDDVEQVRSLLTNMRKAKVNLSQGRHVRRRSGELFIE